MLLTTVLGPLRTGVAKTTTTTREKQQTANQRSNLLCEDLAIQPINRCGTVNRYPPDKWRVQWLDQGHSGPPCRPVVSLRFSSFLLVFRLFSGVSHQICVERRLWAVAVCKAGPIKSETTQRQAPRGRADPLSTMKSAQDRLGPVRSQPGSRGTLDLINSLTV